MKNSKRPSINVALYVRLPNFNIANGIHLAEMLIAACPNDVPAFVVNAQKKLKATVKDAREALEIRKREEGALSEDDRRLLDQEADHAWAGLRQRLLGYTMLPHDQFEQAKQAQDVLTTLFGNEGLSFLGMSYPEQSVAMTTLLERIDNEKLEKAINTLCGPEFLKHLQSIVPRYRTMVEQQWLRTTGSKINLREHTQALSTSILNYTSKVIAMLDESDASSIEKVQEMFRPIDKMRAHTSTRKTHETETDTSLSKPEPSFAE